VIKTRPHLACSAADGLDIKKFKAEVISGAVTFIPRPIKTRQLFQNITTEQEVHTRRNQDELAPVPSYPLEINLLRHLFSMKLQKYSGMLHTVCADKYIPTFRKREVRSLSCQEVL